MCSVVLSVCLLQQRWLVKCKGPLSFPADLARRRRNIAGQACLFFATAAAVCVCRFRGFGLLAAACAHLWRRPRCVCAAFALLWLRVACPHLKRRPLLWLLLPALRIVARWRLPKVAQSLLQSVPVLLSARGRRLCCDHGAAKAWCLLCFFRFGLRLCRRFAELAGHAGWQRLGRQPAGSQSGVEESCGQRGFRQVLLPASECVAAACFYLLRVWALPI